MNTLYTYGYRGGSLADLREYAAAGILILDTRHNPTSPNPLWRRHALSRELGESYRWEKSLGNSNYKTRVPPFEIPELEQGLDTLHELLQASPVLLLCGCPEWRECHRRNISEAARERWPDLPVRHLIPGEGL